MKPVDLYAIRERERKATKGPWTSQRAARAVVAPPGTWLNGESRVVCHEQAHDLQWADDREFIAHARADVPELLELVGLQTRALLNAEYSTFQHVGRPLACGYCGAEETRDHYSDCPIDAALTASGLDTHEKRDAARERLRKAQETSRLPYPRQPRTTWQT